LGWDVDLVVLHREQDDYVDERSPQINVVELGAPRVVLAVPSLVRYLRKRRPVVVLSTLPAMNCAVILAAMAAGSHTRVVLREADVMSEYSRRLRLLVSGLYRRAYRIVAVSDDVRHGLVGSCRLPEAQVVVIRNALDTVRVRRMALGGSVSALLEDGVPVILGVGRLEPQKDFMTLVRALAAVRSKQRCRLVILGRGSQENELRRLSAELGLGDDVVFAGFDPNPFAWMARCRVFVLSSLHEGCPSVLLQAMVCGCHIVATDAPGDARFLLGNGEFGELVPTGDWRLMGKAIERALDKPMDMSRQTRVDQWVSMFGVRETAVAYLTAAGLPSQPSAELNARPQRGKRT
jgi:glycosyltransferase involved in cell wall biosynthesis